MSLISAQSSSALKERLNEERIELSIYHAMFRLRDVRFTPKSGDGKAQLSGRLRNRASTGFCVAENVPWAGL